ncbi:outer membrane protein [Geomobilimonas luticola]|uniref:Outer membrane beta-barrel protein n=1 Tax=Geomobilimonas luticola TaxID=1114878 RepID=A0ABS5SG92_9BACT|nr:outer membrane beta-barrel protein [Geomobilimonas luticola]MBT0654371.1 outer membrane beta-barrel protein [Geomobilimonas luticola]
MKNVTMVLAGILVLAMSSVCFGAGGYVGGAAGVFMPQDSTVTNFDGTRGNQSYDTGYVLTAFGGYAFDSGLRLEGELAYREAELDRAAGTYSYGYYGYNDSLWAFSGMANLFFDLRNNTNVTPYLGGGIGFATVSFDNGYYNQYYYDSEEETVFAYQAGGGVCIDLSRNVALDIGYRYFGTENIHFDFREIELDSHNVTVGVKFKF